ncbi:MAG: hypothetical protein Q4A05_11665 [Ruminococcus sp.]|nr:hypothetical protein [Ruminococcus sp.]
MNNENAMEVLNKIKEAFADVPEDRDEAIRYLAGETGLSEEECATAYDILIKVLPNI